MFFFGKVCQGRGGVLDLISHVKFLLVNGVFKKGGGSWLIMIWGLYGIFL